MGFPVISAPDPFVFTESAVAQAGNSDVSTKTLSSQTINGGIRNIVLIVDGQSNVCNVGSTVYTPTNPTKLDNFNLYDGAIYKAAGALQGCSSIKDANNAPTGRSVAFVAADTIITNNIADRVILIPMGVGATMIADHVSGASSTRLQVVANRWKARGFLLSQISGIMWGQGESDAAGGTLQAAWQASFASYVAAWRALGVNCPIFVATETWNSGAANATIQAAQAAVVNHGSGIWAGPNLDVLDNTNRNGGTDFNDTGVNAAGALWQTALHAFGAPF